MNESSQTSFSLDELSNESGLDTRVIRSFIEQGLMRGPTSLGRYARYSRHHLERLQAIKVLKEKQGLRLSEVRQQLLLMSDAEITALAETGSYAVQTADTSALDYILSQSQQFDTGQVTALAASSSDVHDAVTSGNDSGVSSCPVIPQTQSVSAEPDKKEVGHRSLTDAIKEKLGFKSKPEPDVGFPTRGNVRPDESTESADLTEAGLHDTPSSSHGKGSRVSGAPLSFSKNSAKDEASSETFPGEGDLVEDSVSADLLRPYQAPRVVPGANEVSNPEDEQWITQNRLTTPVDRLVVGLQQQVGSKTVRKQAKKEVWHRIQVTPDIELSVRGIQDEQHLARLERVADYLRELLIGGSYD